jgi:hypothetical protein
MRKIEYGVAQGQVKEKTKLDRYILFAWHDYYPSGAYNDMRATGDCKTTLKHWALDSDPYWDHFKILDTQERVWLNLEDF